MKIFFFVAVAILTAEFYNNTFGIVDQRFFDRFQRDSESLTVGRLVRSKKESPFSHGGFLGWNHPAGAIIPRDYRFAGWGYEVPGHADKFLYQYEALEQGLQVDHYEEYYSMSGGQAFLYHVLGIGVGAGHFLNALFTAAVLCIFLWWVYKRYGAAAAVTGFLFLLCSQWVIVFARNMQYVTGLFFLPFVINLWQPRRVLLYTFVAVLLKCLLAGFDFILPTLFMAVLPVQRKVPVSLVAVAAVMVSLFILWLQLATYYDSWAEAWNYIVATGEKRTLGGRDVSLLDLYRVYANGPAVFGISFQVFFGVTFMATAAGVLLQQYKELMILTWLGMMGPLSWFVIFKDHSINHTHMDYIVWYMPFMLLAPVLIGRMGHSLVRWLL